MSTTYNLPTTVSGVWAPVVTPFLNGSIDFKSYRRLLDRYVNAGINGVIPLGTTGESATIDAREVEALVDFTVDVIGGRVPIYVGIGSNSTKKVIQTVKRLERYPFAGILSVCPYYNQPSEEGILEHFRHIANSTDRNLIIYNIPYRTGVNFSNDSVFKLSEIPNIVGIKDCCGSFDQSVDLLRRKPPGFSVMTGEDALFFTLLALEADGGILAAAQYQPQAFVELFQHMAANDLRGAWVIWSEIEPAVRVMFKESNPMPLKYWLWRQGLISSPECRLPLTQVSPSLAREIDLLQAIAPAEVFG